MRVPLFDSEDQFKEWYLTLGSARDQVEALQGWRRRQIGMVSALTNLVSLLASEQYTQVDHFLLELLQNADDNEFAKTATPELKITLTPDTCVLQCNEQGFTAENVFAISYAAATTKHRAPNARTFIGEKGIGFKSVFGVAEAVEIHSGQFHFELRDGEFIVPHWLGGEPEIGSRIVMRFKPTLTGIASTLSARLQRLADQAQQFVLFLQQLEALSIDDQVAQRRRTVRILRDEETQRYLVESEGESTIYHVESFPVTFPDALVRSRFEHLSGDVVRDIVIALPLPDDLADNWEAGRLFCYLPTAIRIGFPFHIQVDAKTTTNRENIESAAKSRWNSGLLGALPLVLVQLFLKLRDHPDFRDHLPRYLPDPAQLAISNDDLAAAVRQAIDQLKGSEIVLTRQRKFAAPSAVTFAPEGIARWVETQQFEAFLPIASRITMGAMGNVAENVPGAFLHPEWRRYSKQLRAYGVKELTASGIAELFQKGGTPSTVVRVDEAGVRKFLTALMQLPLSDSPYYRDQAIAQLRRAPVFPLRSGKAEVLGALANETMVVSSDASKFSVPRNATVINPLYTYSPGGSASKAIRAFNEKFRSYLTDVLGLRRYTDVDYLDLVVLPAMQVAPGAGPLDHAGHLQLTERWLDIYFRIWRRKNTIVDESGEDRWRKLLDKIGDCYVPTGSPDGRGVIALPLKLTFLPEQLGGLEGIEDAYRAVGAPFVRLPLSQLVKQHPAKKRRGPQRPIDWSDWGLFLRECGAEPGPYLMDLERDTLRLEYLDVHGYDEFYRDMVARVTAPAHSNVRVTGFATSAFEIYTTRLLQTGNAPEVVTRGAALLWDRIAGAKSRVSYRYGRQRSDSIETLDNNFAKAQLGPSLLVRSDQGILRAPKCFLRTSENSAVAEGLLPLVDAATYGNSQVFLEHIGVRPTITAENIDAIAAKLAHDGCVVDDYAPLLRVAARLGRRGARERNWIRTARVFYHVRDKQLLDYDEWRHRHGEVEFPEDIRAELESLFDSIADVPLADLFEDLAAIGDLMPRQSEVIRWLLRVAERMAREDEEAFASAFVRFVRDRGLTVAGRNVKLLTDLPLAWDASPDPLATTSVLLLPTSPLDRVRCETALRVLCWPKLSECAAAPVCGQQDKLEAVTAGQLQLALEDLFGKVEHTNPAEVTRMRLGRIGRAVTRLGEVIVPCTGLAVALNRHGQLLGHYDLPFWWQGSIVYIDTARTPLSRAVATVLDADSGTTIAPFFEAIFSSKQGAAERPPGGPSAAGDGPGSNGDRKPDDAGQSSPAPGAGQRDDAPHGRAAAKQADGPRRRLYSYLVPTAGGNAAAGTRDAGADAAQKRNKEIEDAATKRFREFLQGSGFTCKSVEDDDLGYDFEVTGGQRTLFVEVKGSRDRWVNWEHGLTPNEFRAAQAKGDDYLLCLVERVFESDWEICFIQNPTAQIDGFLFDSPWKQLAIRDRQLLNRFRALEEI